MRVTVTTRGASAEPLPAGWVCVVSGTAVPARHILREGDRVQVFAQTAGG